MLDTGHCCISISPSRLPGRPSPQSGACDRHGHVGRQPGASNGTILLPPTGPAAPRAEHDARVPRGAVRALPDTAAARPRSVEPGPGTARGDQRLPRAAKQTRAGEEEHELASCGAGTSLLRAAACGRPPAASCVCVHAHTRLGSFGGVNQCHGGNMHVAGSHAPTCGLARAAVPCPLARIRIYCGGFRGPW